MKFHAILQLHGKTATGFEIPEEVVASLGHGMRPPVRVSIKGYTYRNTVAPMGGKFMLGVSAEHRKAAGVKAGDMLEIDIELDTELREVIVPTDLKKVLDRDKVAKKFFDGLSYSNKRRHVLLIEQAKTEETRLRRIEKTVSMLREGRR